ncbi:hypothetical protein KC318_g11199 [Hortaea werneckii]|nr:hypothetical protein KC334_g11353 [Hortaea werneckii]KAI6961612.1 hypothetical protein KC355_g12558 [Hortaea werneckii]KAI7658485.1 hypothetical protein KC318_g11199 [Hortaea werneckii]
MEFDTPFNVIDWLDASINVGASGVIFPDSVDASLGVLRMEWFSDQSVADFKTFLYEILSNVPEYTNLKSLARRVRTPIAELSAQEVGSLGLTEVFARLALYITTRFQAGRVTEQDALLDHTPTFSDTYRSHQQPDQAKFKLVMELIAWINKQIYSKGIFFQEDAQARIRTIYDAYVQRPNVDGNAEVRDDVSPRLQYFFPASPDLGDHVILRTERNFPGSLTASKDRLYARWLL